MSVSGPISLGIAQLSLPVM